MVSRKKFNVALILLVSSTLLISCGGKLPGADARKFPADPKKRVEEISKRRVIFKFLNEIIINLIVNFIFYTIYLEKC